MPAATFFRVQQAPSAEGPWEDFPLAHNFSTLAYAQRERDTLEATRRWSSRRGPLRIVEMAHGGRVIAVHP